MRRWGIRVAIVIASIAINLLEALVLYPFFRRAGLKLSGTLLDECIIGLAMGTIICLIQGYFRRRYERALQVAVDELNHHVRNSMQIILNQQALCPYCNIGKVSQAVERVDWALREVLPPEVQPQGTLKNRGRAMPKQRPAASACCISAEAGPGANPVMTHNSPTQAKEA